jgi:hypothetical protein
VTYIYDTNSLDTSHTFSNYTSGRLAAVQCGPVNTSTTNPNGTYLPTFAEWCNYQLSGLVATKRLQVLQPNYGITTPQAINFDGAYTYDTGGEGRFCPCSIHRRRPGPAQSTRIRSIRCTGRWA